MRGHIPILFAVLIWSFILVGCSVHENDTLPLKGRVIAIEAGHEPSLPGQPCHTNGGGVGTSSFNGAERLTYPGNPLACPNGAVPEHALTEDIGRKLKRLIETAGGKTVWTRLDEIEATPEGRERNLKARAEKANKAEADVLIDIHANGSSSPADSGYLLIIHCTGVDSIHEGNTPLPIDSSGCYPDRTSEKFTKSLELARKIDYRLAQLSYNGRRITKKGEIYGADLWVPGTARMPTVLVEVGFMTDRHDMDLLAEEEYRRMLTRAFYQAVVDYFAGEPK
ncbi:MAG: N-acetylmuramoyl-L-alanine amidase [Gemmatimonadota bacterium]|nr:MAG: N-acetylmuramoyl-L-alanine amidase [Gemmatimonadota bacterium]